ncbi:MAG: DUF1330 domain-containing protein [Motiliproteus sp.]
MPYEMLVGLNVLDDTIYQTYRQEMKPILSSYGGGFRCDFKVSEVLLPDSGSEINRVFTIYFNNHEAMEEFFSNPEYMKIKKQYFEHSVGSTTVLASYETAL